MKQSTLISKTIKEPPKDELSLNASLLIKAGFVDKLMSGVYSYLPLGLRVHQKIEAIVREEMNAIGGQEILLPALQPKELWEKTGRWGNFDVLYRLKSRAGQELTLGPTHEEVLTPLVHKFVNSYRDLPFAVYQIQVKFRDEPRARSGLLRGREFIMKDMYSFHADENDRSKFYQQVAKSYEKIFSRCGLTTYAVEAAAGTFGKLDSKEFMVISEEGEDKFVYCKNCGFAANIGVLEKGYKKCPRCQKLLTLEKGIEVAHIFNLGTKFSDYFNANFQDNQGRKKTIIMGCYGLGLNRTLATIVETNNDKDGIIWPKNVAPFDIHLLLLSKDRKWLKTAENYYKDLQKSGFEVLYDERDDSPGKKLKDADLIGIPARLVVSDRTKDKLELKFRNKNKTYLVSYHEAEKIISSEK